MCTLPKAILAWLWKWQVHPLHSYSLTQHFFLQVIPFQNFWCLWLHSVILQYQNCLKRFCYSTDTQVLLYLARTHYEAEQWQDCKKTLLRAIHLAPSNYTLRFDAGVAMQKFSASTLQKTKRSADEVCWCHIWSFFRWYFFKSLMKDTFCFYEVAWAGCSLCQNLTAVHGVRFGKSQNIGFVHST